MLPLPNLRPPSPLPHELSRSQLSHKLSQGSRSILNRLRSIHADSQFPLALQEAYNFRLPLVVNKRAGEWYVPPEKCLGSVYFKSTDGHTGNWSFSLRRLNLHLLELLGKAGGEGVIIVDSTRRGKRFPDSLSKTIPIWCAVINSVLFPSSPAVLHTPPQAVSAQENAYIDPLIPTFVSQLLSLNINFKQLPYLPQKPLRPCFITPDDFYLPNIDPEDKSTSLIFKDYTPLLLVSASRIVKNEAVEGEYIQGAGDDAENWLKSIHLDPSFFWSHHDEILACSSDEGIIELVKTIRQSEFIQTAIEPPEGTAGAYPVSPDHTLSISISKNPFQLGQTQNSTSEQKSNQLQGVSSDRGLVIAFSGETALNAPKYFISPTLPAEPAGKRVARMLRETILPQLRIFLAKQSAQQAGYSAIQVMSGDPGDLSIAVALFLLCVWYDDNGTLCIREAPTAEIDKPYIRRRLAWITSSLGQHANISRANLNSVNAVLMQRP